MNLNKELHEAFGHKWGHDYTALERYKNNSIFTAQCTKCGHTCDSDLIINNEHCPADPDYKADPRLVLGEMEKRGSYESFVAYLFDTNYPPDNIHMALMSGTTLLIILDLIMDDTGKLAQLALDWIRGKQKK